MAFLKDLNAISRGTTLFRDDKLKRYGISGYQVKYLFNVCNNRGVSQDELARALFVNKSNVTRQIAALERAGLVRREQAAEDKRVYRIYPTAKAEELMPTIRAVNDEWKELICAGLSRDDIEKLGEVLEKLVNNAKRYGEERR